MDTFLYRVPVDIPHSHDSFIVTITAIFKKKEEYKW